MGFARSTSTRPSGERAPASERDAREPAAFCEAASGLFGLGSGQAAGRRPRWQATTGAADGIASSRAASSATQPARTRSSAARIDVLRQVARDHRRVGLQLRQVLGREAGIGAAVGTDLVRRRRARCRSEPPRSTPTSARTPCRLELGEKHPSGRVVAHASDHGRLGPELRPRSDGGVEGRAAGRERDAGAVPLPRATTSAMRSPTARNRAAVSQCLGGHYGRSQRRAASSCSSLGPPASERAAGLEHARADRACGASLPASAARGTRRRSARTGARASARSRPGLPAREHAEELDDRGRAADLGRRRSVRGGAPRSADAPDRPRHLSARAPPAGSGAAPRPSARGSAEAGSARTGGRSPSRPSRGARAPPAKASSSDVVASIPMSAASSRFSSSVTSVRCFRVMTS